MSDEREDLNVGEGDPPADENRIMKQVQIVYEKEGTATKYHKFRMVCLF